MDYFKYKKKLPPILAAHGIHNPVFPFQAVLPFHVVATTTRQIFASVFLFSSFDVNFPSCLLSFLLPFFLSSSVSNHRGSLAWHVLATC